MALGMEVGLGPGHIVLKMRQRPPIFGPNGRLPQPLLSDCSTFYEKLAQKIQVMYGSLTLPAPTGEAYNRDRICIWEKSHQEMRQRR